MKKIILILFLFPIIVFGQGCQYGSAPDASKLCDFFEGDSYPTDANTDLALNKILTVTGLSKRFVLKQCNDISNCLAVSYKGIRYIIYDKDFMDEIATSTSSWSNISILSHEIGHHVNGHPLDIVFYKTDLVEPPTLSESRQMELEADEFSGFVMFKLGATLAQAQEAINVLPPNENDLYSTHPSKDKRLNAISNGYYKAKSQDSNHEYSTNNSNLNANDYFYMALNSQSNPYKIENYTKAINLDPALHPAYFKRANAYMHSGNFQEALVDYSKAISIDNKYHNLFFNRSLAYSKLGNHNEAIADLTRVLNLVPDDFSAYNSIGKEYSALGNYNEAIVNFTKAININPDYALAYSNRGASYLNMKNYDEAIADFTRAISKDPSYSVAYFNRGNVYFYLGNYYLAIDNYSQAIALDYSFISAYKNRGLAKSQVGLPFCLDYKKACELGEKKCCEWFHQQCR